MAPVADQAEFAFFLHATTELGDPGKRFKLSPEDIALLNPNTRTCPIFRSRQDAELTRHIYRRVPVLINENDPQNGNPWGIKFSTMFHMSNDSQLFKTRQDLEAEGWQLKGNTFHKDRDTYLPLYEGRMVHYFDHRACSVTKAKEGVMRTAASEETTVEEHCDPSFAVKPRYWMENAIVRNASPEGFTAECYIAFKDVTSATNERTFISTIIPMVASGHKTPLILPGTKTTDSMKFLSLASSFACDFVCRQKLGGVSLTFFVLKQLPFVLPEAVNQLGFENRILELTYTAWDLEPFARDCGYDGPPFRWDEDRRFLLRCELDAAFFHLYLGTPEEWQAQAAPELLEAFPTPRHAVDYIMETFPIVKRKDLARTEEKDPQGNLVKEGTYRTKDTILTIYDEMQTATETNQPYPTRLNPPPADPSCAHPPKS